MTCPGVAGGAHHSVGGMQNDPSCRPLSSSSWTGIPDGASTNPLDRPHYPALERWPRNEALMAFLLLLLGFILYSAWWGILSFHSPTAPHPASGHTMSLSLGRGSGRGIYVTEFEGLVALFLGLLAFIMPGAYLAWRSFRRHKAKRGFPG